MFVTDEGMLGLNLEELRYGVIIQIMTCRLGLIILTENATFASSNVERIKSLPARGTWVSFRGQ